MAKSVLKFDDEDYDFILIGIASTFHDFRVCREINTILSIELHRSEDYSIHDRKNDVDILFPFFEYINDQEDRYYVIGNKSDGRLLIPEQRQLDFFLLIKSGNAPVDQLEIIRSLNKATVFHGVFPITVSSLKSKENLLF